MPDPKMNEQARASMHEGEGVTDSGEPVELLYTNLTDPSGLADLLLDARVDIRLVRGTCLKALEREKQTFIRRQELESHPRYPDAFVTCEELQKWKTDAAYRSKVRIIGVSHVWETREHPDPRGNQLALIAGAQLWHDEYSWYFLDYMSVYQFYRTSVHQNRSFQYTMMHMHFFYTHEYTWTYRIEDLAPIEEADLQKLIQVFFTETGIPEDGKVDVRHLADLVENATPYFRRGWCEAECQWSSMRSKSRQTVSLSNVSPQTWTRAPMAPAVFQTKVANRELLFTHQDSAEAVKELQARVFMEKADECETLELALLPPREFPILSGALLLYKHLVVLQVSNSQVDCHGAEALSTALTMRELHLNNLRIPGDAVRKLALGFKGNGTLLKVTFTWCLVDAEGAEGLAEALACKKTRLESLDLSHNVLKCKGAKHLADALIQNCVLQELDLSSNIIADDGAASFAGLFKSSALKLSLDDNCFGKEAIAILQKGRDEVLSTRGGKVDFMISYTGGPKIFQKEFGVFATIFMISLFTLFGHVYLTVWAFCQYFQREELPPPEAPPVGDLELFGVWFTVPSILLVISAPILAWLQSATAYSIWTRIWVCYSAVWIPAMQLYTLVAIVQSPVDLHVWWYYLGGSPTLLWEASILLLAWLVMFHPTQRAVFRLYIRECRKL
ncbi:NLRC3 [Symbiodinium sp. CCMP2592]|nr:NLRC3 [Symbiodinium sp. CCMP2592]